MSITAGSLQYLLPIIERIVRFPGKIVVVASGIVTALALAMGWAAGRTAESVVSWWPFIVSVIFAVAVATFGVLRFRLAQAVDSSIDKMTQSLAGSDDVTIINPDGTYVGAHAHTFDDEVARVRASQRRRDAQAAAAHKRNVFFPRIEAAQRAAIAGAGGVENAPYLKYDVRIILLSAILSIVAIPVGIFTFVVSLIIWL
ncbi:hypothetical protein [Arcanobacterium phocae]|uniref:hypothetical protein n=1 Tax=Arcanobacterium phocae TaxID=131112 RepID=UPI001C0EA9C0|nr:hypothetical protein [Arcanobacterium phocae]